MNTSERRLKELETRVTVKNRLEGLKLSDGWTEVLKIIRGHIEKHNRRVNSKTLEDDKKVKALVAKRAIEDLLIDIDNRIYDGKSALQTLKNEEAVLLTS